MRALLALFLLAAIVSPCWAGLDDDPTSPFYVPPEVKAAKHRAYGEIAAAKILADQRPEDSIPPEQQPIEENVVVTVLGGLVIVLSIVVFAQTRTGKRPPPAYRP